MLGKLIFKGLKHIVKRLFLPLRPLLTSVAAAGHGAVFTPRSAFRRLGHKTVGLLYRKIDTMLCRVNSYNFDLDDLTYA